MKLCDATLGLCDYPVPFWMLLNWESQSGSQFKSQGILHRNNAHNWISISSPIQLIIVKEKYFLSICVDTSTLINWPKLGKSLQIHFMSRIRGDAESPNDWLTWTSVFVAASSLYLGTMAALRGSFTSSFPLLDSTFTCTGASPERRPLTKS